MSQGANKYDIISAGETALVCLNNGNPHHGINVLRYDKLGVNADTNTVSVQPGALPLTSGSVKYHRLRVYHQIQECVGVEMSSVDWDWKVSAGNLLPIMTDLQHAPQKFLEVVHCGCKSACDTMCCSCMKHRMTCSTAFSECRSVWDNTHNDIDSKSDKDT